MSDLPWDVVGLAGVLAANRLLVPRVALKPGIFWPIQAVTAGLAVGVAVAGLPGLTEYGAVKWLVAGLLAFHVAQNLSIRSMAQHKQDRDAFERELSRHVRGQSGRDAESDDLPPAS